MNAKEYDARCEALIAEHGWMVQGVGGSKENPEFSYTVGLHRLGLPEIITFALPMRTAQGILNHVAALLNADDATITHGDRRDDVIVGYPVEFIQVLHGEEYLRTANRLARKHGYGTTVDALQMLWPDRAGRFPGDSGFDVGGPIPLLGVRG